MSTRLLALPATDAAARAQVLRRLELAVARRLDGREAGEHATASYGPGSERAGARPYEAGDDARLVDWNLTARSGSVWVRQTEADRELETWVVADRSASLDFGTALGEKRDVVLGAVAAFGTLCVRAGDRLGLVVAGTDALTRLPARRGRTAFLAALATVHATPRTDGPPAPGADLGSALRRLLVSQPSRSRVVVVSDFLGDSDWRERLSALARRHDVVAVHVTDPRELELPAVGILAVVDTETGQQRYVDAGSMQLRARYAAAATERHRGIAHDIERSGAAYVHLSTDRDWLTDIALFVTDRARTRRARPSADAIARFAGGATR
jgi:uncharacterized protein (DUF58 family)